MKSLRSYFVEDSRSLTDRPSAIRPEPLTKLKRTLDNLLHSNQLKETRLTELKASVLSISAEVPASIDSLTLEELRHMCSNFPTPNEARLAYLHKLKTEIHKVDQQFDIELMQKDKLAHMEVRQKAKNRECALKVNELKEHLAKYEAASHEAKSKMQYAINKLTQTKAAVKQYQIDSVTARDERKQELRLLKQQVSQSKELVLHLQQNLQGIIQQLNQEELRKLHLKSSLSDTLAKEQLNRSVRGEAAVKLANYQRDYAGLQKALGLDTAVDIEHLLGAWRAEVSTGYFLQQRFSELTVQKERYAQNLALLRSQLETLDKTVHLIDEVKSRQAKLVDERVTVNASFHLELSVSSIKKEELIVTVIGQLSQIAVSARERLNILKGTEPTECTETTSSTLEIGQSMWHCDKLISAALPHTKIKQILQHQGPVPLLTTAFESVRAKTQGLLSTLSKIHASTLVPSDKLAPLRPTVRKMTLEPTERFRILPYSVEPIEKRPSKHLKKQGRSLSFLPGLIPKINYAKDFSCMQSKLSTIRKKEAYVFKELHKVPSVPSLKRKFRAYFQ